MQAGHFGKFSTTICSNAEFDNENDNEDRLAHTSNRNTICFFNSRFVVIFLVRHLQFDENFGYENVTLRLIDKCIILNSKFII